MSKRNSGFFSLYPPCSLWFIPSFLLLILATSAAVADTGGSTPAPEDCPLGHVSRAVAGPIPKPVISRKKQLWERRHGGKEAAKPHIVARLSARPSLLLADKSSLPQDETEFAWRVARDTWRGLQAFTDKENGLPVDHVRLSAGPLRAVEPNPEAHPNGHAAEPSMQDVAGLEVGDYTNVTNIGMRLIAIVAAAELELLSRDEALAAMRQVLASLEGLETRRGLLFNYYDTTAMERTSNFLSFVDSAWLSAGLMVARNAFPEVQQRCTKLIERTDFGFFYDRKTHQIAHGYFADPPGRSPYDYGMLYTEARLGSLIAIGKGDVARRHWLAMARVLPVGCAWQSLPPVATAVRESEGVRVPFGHYEWKGERFLPSWGGSMFEALMPTLVLDEAQHAAASLGWNDRQHAVVQRRYALEELGYPVWGMSPSARPGEAGYSEFGVSVLGVRGYGAGAVTPHASALALAVIPQAALANLHKLAELYDIYGEYGFYDAVDPRSGAVAYSYLALDQSMLFIALANHLKPHCIQKHFTADPIANSFLPLLKAEDALWLGDAAAVEDRHGER